MSIEKDDWNWDNSDDEALLRTPCLFCKEYTQLDELMIHIPEVHKITFEQLYKISNGIQYNYIKLINYIRKHKLTVEQVQQFDMGFFDLPESNKYLAPSINDDGLLMVDAEWADDDYTLANTIDKMDDIDDEVRKELILIKEEEAKEMQIEENESDDSDD